VKRAIYVLLGIVSLLLGLALIALGATVAAVFGSDDSISTAPARVDGAGVALVTENLRVDASSISVPRGVGTLTLSVKAPDGREMFAGTAKPDDLDTYLTGAPYDVVVDLTSGSAARTRHVPGTQQPPPPSGQSFWVSSSQGLAPAISTALGPGDALVVMNADASPRVKADVVVTYSLPRAWTGAWVAVGVGVLLFLLALVAFWRARVARRRRDEQRAAAALAATSAASAAAAPATVLPDTPSPEPVAVPAWAAAAPGALDGDELSGPPSGSIVVDPASDGSQGVVASTPEPAVEPTPEPDAGWYPAAAVAAAAAVATDDETRSDSEAVADVDTDTDTAAEAEAEADEAQSTEVVGAEPAEAGEQVAAPVDAHDADATQEIPVTAPDAAPALDEPAASDDPMYAELASWFRDDGAGHDGGPPAAR
jgi:hypothetical protein